MRLGFPAGVGTGLRERLFRRHAGRAESYPTQRRRRTHSNHSNEVHLTFAFYLNIRKP